MSSHHHVSPLNPTRSHSTALPPNVYGALVGKLGGPINNDTNPTHVLIPLEIASGQFAGSYQLAFNTESDDKSEDQYYVHDEPISNSDVPDEGFTSDASLSYTKLGLTDSVFVPVQNGQLRTIVTNSLSQADLISAYGMTYSTGNGLHDIHCQNGEDGSSGHGNHPNQDGALALYYLNRSGQTTRRWIFIKFDTEHLG